MATSATSAERGPSRHWLDPILFPDHRDHWDDELLRREILDVVEPAHVVLDLGAGRGAIPAMNFRHHVKRVVGIDVDRAVRHNAFLDGACVGDAARLPFADETFDVVFSDNVLEHLEWPELVFREVARVLKPGGRFVVKTPNRWHYVTPPG